MRNLNHKHIAAILLVAVVAFGINSCNSSENDSKKYTGTVKVSIPISGTSFADDVSTRSATNNDTVWRDVRNRMIMEVAIETDKGIQTRAINIVPDGTQVLVAIYKGSALYKVINTSINNGKISSLELPTEESLNLKFFSHGDGSALPIALNGQITDTSNDLMFGEINGVTLASDGSVKVGNLSNGFTFKHLYSRVRIKLTTSAGIISDFSGLELGGDSWYHKSVDVNLYDGTLSNFKRNIACKTLFPILSLGTATVITDYKYFIADPTTAPHLTFTSVTTNNVTYVNSASYMLSKRFTNGKSYMISILLKVPSYTVSYSAGSGVNGVTNLPADQSKTEGTNLTLSSTRPIRANSDGYSYSFLGWSKTSGADVVDLVAGANVTDADLGHTVGGWPPEGPITPVILYLYAVWLKSPI